MPSPTLRDVHIDAPLTNISVAYINTNFIGEQIFPRVPVNKKTDLYFVFPKDAWFRDEVAIRAPGARAHAADYEVTTASYMCITYALSKLVPDEVRANADTPLRPDVEATEFVTNHLLRAQERRIAALVTGSTNWSYAASPTTQWSSDTSDPFSDIVNAVDGVVGAIGEMPNVGVMSWPVWRSLQQHPDLLDRVKYTRPSGALMLSDLSSWFGLDRLYVGTALYNSAQEGATVSMSYIWDDDFWVGYVPSTPALMTPAAGYTLEWMGRQVRRFRREEEYTDVVEASHSTDEIISASDAGAVVYNAV